MPQITAVFTKDGAIRSEETNGNYTEAREGTQSWPGQVAVTGYNHVGQIKNAGSQSWVYYLYQSWQQVILPPLPSDPTDILSVSLDCNWYAPWSAYDNIVALDIPKPYPFDGSGWQTPAMFNAAQQLCYLSGGSNGATTSHTNASLLPWWQANVGQYKWLCLLSQGHYQNVAPTGPTGAGTYVSGVTLTLRATLKSTPARVRTASGWDDRTKLYVRTNGWNEYKGIVNL